MFAFGWLALAREWLETTLGDLGLPFDGGEMIILHCDMVSKIVI